jgi:hypothetical protein
VPASVELLPLSSEQGFRIDCGLRVSGGWSRRPEVTLKHSFSLHFRSVYGKPRLNYAVFPGSDVTSFDTLRLRGGQADSFPYFAHKAQYLHDQWARETQRQMGWLSPRGRPVHLLLDGLYWGIYELAEEPSAAFAAAHLGDAEAAWDVVMDGRRDGLPGPPEAEDGDLRAFRSMQDVVDGQPEPDPDRPEDRAAYERLASLLDIGQHVDYTLLQIYGANVDWPLVNYRAIRDRELPDRFQFLVWDYEHTTALRDDPGRGFCQTRSDPDTGECGYIADTAGVVGLHGWLARFPEYRLAFADRAAQHPFGSGALVPHAAASRYARLAEVIEPAIVAEATRWGTGRPQPQAKLDQDAVWNEYNARISHGPQTLTMWRAERDRVLRDFFGGRTAAVIAQLCRRGLLPPVNPPEAVVTGSEIAGPASITLRVSDSGCPNGRVDGAIAYTLDGSDPREPWTGALARTAHVYEGPVSARDQVRLRARAFVDSPTGREWSAASDQLVGAPDVRVSEVMYHPAAPAGSEFVEVENRSDAAVGTRGLALAGAVTGSLRTSEIPPGGFALLAPDAAAFHASYPGVPLAGTYSGRLDNAGETLILHRPHDAVDETIAYRDDGFWPPAADGLGYSLVPSRAEMDPSRPESWRASSQPGGSPGRVDPEPPAGAGAVVPSEILACPGDHQEDAVELQNISDDPIDIGGWYLSDDLDDLAKYAIPAPTVLGAGGFASFYRGAFGADPVEGFGLAAAGEAVYLTAVDPDGAMTGAVAPLPFGACEPGVSWGRVATAWGPTAAPLQRQTFGIEDARAVESFRAGRGAPNAPPLVGPVVVNEVLFATDSRAGAFVELLNTGTVPVRLGGGPYDRPWRLDGTIKFAFPAGTELAPGDLALVVGGDPATFRRSRPVPPATQVMGPFSGPLACGSSALSGQAGVRPEHDDGGACAGTVALARPAGSSPSDRTALADAEEGMDVGAEGPGGTAGSDGAEALADWVRFGPGPPWPSVVAPPGRSIERLHPHAFGGDPANWSALVSGGTPGEHTTRRWPVWLPLVVEAR